VGEGNTKYRPRVRGIILNSLAKFSESEVDKLRSILTAIIALSLISSAMFLLAGQVSAEGSVTIEWKGHSCFVFTSSEGVRVLTDPFSEGVGYALPEVEVDVVTVTHEHYDHNNVGVAKGDPTILRGLAGNKVAKIDQEIKGVRFRTVPSFHDDAQGKKRGLNAIFVIEMDGIKIAHLGDLGHILTKDQVKSLGTIDILLIPVGGRVTIDGAQAQKVMAQLNPKIAIPMHYGTPDLSFSLDPVDDFLKGQKNVMREDKLIISKEELTGDTKIVVLTYK